MRIPYYGNKQINHGFGVGSTIHYYDSNSWGLDKEFLPSIHDFDPNKEYTEWELDRFADAILWKAIDNGERNFHDPVILMYEHLKERRKHEVYTTIGGPDETLTNELSADGQMMYWRTHPQGRKVNDEKIRVKSGASFYR